MTLVGGVIAFAAGASAARVSGIPSAIAFPATKIKSRDKNNFFIERLLGFHSKHNVIGIAFILGSRKNK
jgi:hypothetical protein